MASYISKQNVEHLFHQWISFGVGDLGAILVQEPQTHCPGRKFSYLVVGYEKNWLQAFHLGVIIRYETEMESHNVAVNVEWNVVEAPRELACPVSDRPNSIDAVSESPFAGSLHHWAIFK